MPAALWLAQLRCSQAVFAGLAGLATAAMAVPDAAGFHPGRRQAGACRAQGVLSALRPTLLLPALQMRWLVSRSLPLLASPYLGHWCR